jgi:hypothetical protein
LESRSDSARERRKPVSDHARKVRFMVKKGLSVAARRCMFEIKVHTAVFEMVRTNEGEISTLVMIQIGVSRDLCFSRNGSSE